VSVCLCGWFPVHVCASDTIIDHPRRQAKPEVNGGGGVSISKIPILFQRPQFRD